MNYKIQVQVWLGTQRRDTVWCIIGGELWHESSVFRFVDYRALALIMQKLQGELHEDKWSRNKPETRYGATLGTITFEYSSKQWPEATLLTSMRVQFPH